MKYLYFDIETAPASEEYFEVLQEDYETRKAKGKNVPETFQEYLDATGLSGEFGRIVCLAYAINDDPVEVLWGEEKDILADFWAVAKGTGRFIGHNILEFDFPFVVKRSRILGVRPSLMPSFARYRQTPIYDTMKEWDLWGRGQASLDLLAKALGLQTSKDVMDGSQVGEYFKAGRIEEIAEYCKKDVALTRQVYKRLTFDGTLPGL